MPFTLLPYAHEFLKSQNAMHVAFVIENLHGGGAQRVVLVLAGGLADLGHTVDLVLFEPIIRQPVPDGVRLFAIRNL